MSELGTKQGDNFAKGPGAEAEGKASNVNIDRSLQMIFGLVVILQGCAALSALQCLLVAPVLMLFFLESPSLVLLPS